MSHLMSRRVADDMLDAAVGPGRAAPVARRGHRDEDGYGCPGVGTEGGAASGHAKRHVGADEPVGDPGRLRPAGCVLPAPVAFVRADYYPGPSGHGRLCRAAGDLAGIFPLMYVILALPCGRWLDARFERALSVGAILTAGGGLLRLVGPVILWVGPCRAVRDGGGPAVGAELDHEGRRAVFPAGGADSCHLGRQRSPCMSASWPPYSLGGPLLIRAGCASCSPCRPPRPSSAAGWVILRGPHARGVPR